MQLLNLHQTNVKFTGVYCNPQKDNQRNRKLDYKPYCWESNNTGKMAQKSPIDIYSNILPDNEIANEKLSLSSDILETKLESTNSKTIINQKPSMNREESLEVLNKKLEKFVEKKLETQKKLSNELEKLNNNTSSSSNFYDTWSKEYHKSYFVRDFTKSEIKTEMDLQKDFLKENSEKLYTTTEQYMQLSDSIFSVMNTRLKNIEEINKLKDLRSKGLLIDISCQDVANPNEPLHNALKHFRNISEKYVCTPNQTLSIKEIFKTLNLKNIPNKISSQNIVEYIEKLIKKTV